MSLNAEERASIIAKAMDRSFGELLVWKRPVLAHSFGENDLGQVDIFEEALEKIRADVVFAFEQMSNDDLSQMDLESSDNFRISEHNPAALSVKKMSGFDVSFLNRLPMVLDIRLLLQNSNIGRECLG